MADDLSMEALRLSENCLAEFGAASGLLAPGNRFLTRLQAREIDHCSLDGRDGFGREDDNVPVALFDHRCDHAREIIVRTENRGVNGKQFHGPRIPGISIH